MILRGNDLIGEVALSWEIDVSDFVFLIGSSFHA